MKKSVLFLMLFISCKSENKSEIKLEKANTLSSEPYKKKYTFKNKFILDSALKIKEPDFLLTISNLNRTDSILALCNCQKDKKNNSIKIQIRSGIPTKKQSDTLKSHDKKKIGILQLSDLGYSKKIDGQFKLLTFVLKDSAVKSIELYSKSTENEYNNTDFSSMTIKKYKMKISTFDYSIASDVIGEFNLRLPQEFGYFENDTILKGSFNCNNWLIKTKDDIKNWNIRESFKNRNSDRGFQIKK